MQTQNMALEAFSLKVQELVDNHPIVKHNAFTSSFSEGKADMDELQHFTVQFSVFSHLFIEAQLRKCINSLDLQSYRAGKEILMNELGVVFNRDGSVEGGKFKFDAGHFEWLADFAAHLGLPFNKIGKPSHGTKATMEFCQALMSWYGSEDWSTAAGASHAIEHWAAAGFWKELICGLKKIKSTRLPELPLGFWVWHDQIEDQHAAHTDDELSMIFNREGFSQESFLKGAWAILDAVQVFWDGLEADKIEKQAA